MSKINVLPRRAERSAQRAQATFAGPALGGLD